MEDVYLKIVELFKEDRFSVLATIIRQTGSSPRGVGTKFLIMEDGSYVGTIGGGLLEAQVLEGAQGVFATRSPKRLRFTLMGTDVEATDMLCGGDVEVFLEPVSPGNLNYLQIFKRVLEIGRRGGSGILATIVNEDRWRAREIPKIFIEADGKRIGSLPGIQQVEKTLLDGIERVIEKRQPTIILFRDDIGDELDLFIEPVLSEPVLYIFGGGHISTQIVPLASRVGFKVVVIDDRQEFAHPEKFPEATEVYQYPFEGLMDKLPVGDASFLVIVTRGHIHDKTVLTQSLKTPAKYIGMIGSRRKRHLVYQKLLEEGFTEKDLNRVHAPIGLDIGAETPEEIAVSIVAELIMVRAGMERR
ncbi:MAG: XdhC family aldehyde oxidoreductase maturation factor [Pseudomonadota bacterium]